MVNDIVIGVTRALDSRFDNTPIYTDSVEQGLMQPCFFVIPILEMETGLLGRRAIRNISLDIHYISKEGRMRMEGVASTLYGVLRKIELLDGSLIAGHNLHHEINDGVLHFYVDYRFTIYYEGEKVALQENLHQDLEVKE